MLSPSTRSQMDSDDESPTCLAPVRRPRLDGAAYVRRTINPRSIRSTHCKRRHLRASSRPSAPKPAPNWTIPQFPAPPKISSGRRSKRLFHALAALDDLAPGGLSLVGETTLSHLQTRPDYAVSVDNALVGFIEVKAPGKGCDPRKFSDPHDKAQWGKLKSLPNLVYTDGNGFSLWRDGELAGENRPARRRRRNLRRKAEGAGDAARARGGFPELAPQPPTSVKALAQTSARLCRLLREEVLEEMAAGHGSLQHLEGGLAQAAVSRGHDEQFADGYAQAVTFGLLMARAFEISLKDGIELAAIELKKTNT